MATLIRIASKPFPQYCTWYYTFNRVSKAPPTGLGLQNHLDLHNHPQIDQIWARLHPDLVGRGGLVNITRHQLWLLGSTVHHLNSLHQLVQDPDGLQLPLSKQQLPLLRADPLTHLLLLGQAHLVHGLRLPLCLSVHKGQEEGIMFSVPYLAALL